MSIDWQTILTDVEKGLQAAQLAVNAAAAVGVPDAAVVAPLIALAKGLADDLEGLSNGTLTPIQTAVQGVEQQADAMLAEKTYPDGK
jgi:hypothetical protein